MTNNNQPMAQAFQQFMNQMRGQDPQKIIDNMIRSGQITQPQLNMIQRQAKQMESEFEGFKRMFGF